MRFMEVETPAECDVVAGVFELAAIDISLYGWKPGGCVSEWEQDPDGAYPRCTWIALRRAGFKLGVTDIGMECVDTALIRHFELNPHDGRALFCLFSINDDRLPEEGQAWAVEQLRQIAAKLRGVSVDQLERVPVTV